MSFLKSVDDIITQFVEKLDVMENGSEAYEELIGSEKITVMKDTDGRYMVCFEKEDDESSYTSRQFRDSYWCVKYIIEECMAKNLI